MNVSARLDKGNPNWQGQPMNETGSTKLEIRNKSHPRIGNERNRKRRRFRRRRRWIASRACGTARWCEKALPAKHTNRHEWKTRVGADGAARRPYRSFASIRVIRGPMLSLGIWRMALAAQNLNFRNGASNARADVAGRKSSQIRSGPSAQRFRDRRGLDKQSWRRGIRGGRA